MTNTTTTTHQLKAQQRAEQTQQEHGIEEQLLSATNMVLLPELTDSVLKQNNPPHFGFEQSINPYQGCELGCLYCYARPSHTCMNLMANADFETKIFYQANAAKILASELSKPTYVCKPIILGSHTDPYQPAEQKLKLTRSILEVLQRYHHPVAIITKSTLIERDLDIIANMANRHLAKIIVSITTLRPELKDSLEPRAASPQDRLDMIRTFSQAGVPVRVIAAPIIPLINDMELERILGIAATQGALHASYSLLHLPEALKPAFQTWLATHYPDRAEQIMRIVQQIQGEKPIVATYHEHVVGEGEFATLLAQRFQLACKRFKLNMLPSCPLHTEEFHSAS